MKASLWLRFALVMGGAAIIMGGCAAPKPTSAPTTQPTSVQVTAQPEIAAVVNGTPISMEAYNRELARWNAGRSALGMDEAGPIEKQKILDEMINDELVRQTAAKQGIVVPDSDVDAQINQSIQQYGQDYLNSWLTSNFYTMAEFREFVRLELISDKLKQPVIDAVPTSAPEVHARHILVNSRPEAEEVLAKLQSGQDFGALAAEYSVDVTTRSNGGDLGWFPRGGLLVPQVEDAAFSLQPGQVSGVVVSDWGYHIVQTLEVGTQNLDPDTRQRLIRQALDAWRQGLRTGANIQQLVNFTS